MDFSRPARDRVSMSIQPALHLLSHQLRIVSVGKEHLHELTYSLLQLTLKLLGKDTSCRKYVYIIIMILYNYYHLCVCRNHFYSFTETDSEYSLVLDDDLFTGELYLYLFVIFIYNYIIIWTLLGWYCIIQQVNP